MKGDLKKKFLDILFEQDPEDEEYSEPKQIKEEKKETVKENKTVPRKFFIRIRNSQVLLIMKKHQKRKQKK